MAVEKVVVELNSRVGHLEPSDVDSLEEIVWKGGHLAAVDDKVGHLVAAEALDCRAEHLGVLNVPTVGHHLGLGLAWVRGERVKGLLVVCGQVASGSPASAAAAAWHGCINCVGCVAQLATGGRPSGHGEALQLGRGGARLARVAAGPRAPLPVRLDGGAARAGWSARANHRPEHNIGARRRLSGRRPERGGIGLAGCC